MSNQTELCSTFQSAFSADEGSLGPCPSWSGNETRSLVGSEPAFYTEFINLAARSSFDRGLLRFLLPTTVPSLQSWNAPSGWMADWPNVPKFFSVFAFDWQGNQYGFDKRRVERGEPAVGMLEPGFGKLLRIAANFAEFVGREIIENRDAVLASGFYKEWLAGVGRRRSKCVGYRVPAFLNGNDEIDNLEISNMEVYLSITGQLFAARREQTS